MNASTYSLSALNLDSLSSTWLQLLKRYDGTVHPSEPGRELLVKMEAAIAKRPQFPTSEGVRSDEFKDKAAKDRPDWLKF